LGKDCFGCTTNIFAIYLILLLTTINRRHSQIPKRKAVECRIQWLQNDHPSINHAKWKKDELSELYRIADEHGCRDWVKISQELGVGFALYRSSFSLT
jgi:hypothetical protein